MARRTKFWLASPFLLIFVMIAMFPILYVLWGGIGSAIGLIGQGMSKDPGTKSRWSTHSFLSTGNQGATLYLEIGLMDKAILEDVDSLWQHEDLIAAYGKGVWLILSDAGPSPKFLTASSYSEFLTLKAQLLLPKEARLRPL